MNQHSELNPKFRFETFIVSPENLTAHIAAMEVSESPGNVHNPLVICSGAGMGKTQLLHAIAKRLLINFPDFYVFYTTSENFMNQFITAYRYDKIVEFREIHRKIDVLLFDDFQFIANKKKTQEELVHLFDILLPRNKQIVVACVKSLLEIQGVDERLKSLFTKGLIVHIRIEIDTKVAILMKMAESEKIELAKDVAEFMAHNLDDDIRILEDGLNRLSSHAKSTGEKITTDMVRKVLSHFL